MELNLSRNLNFLLKILTEKKMFSVKKIDIL